MTRTIVSRTKFAALAILFGGLIIQTLQSKEIYETTPKDSNNALNKLDASIVNNIDVKLDSSYSADFGKWGSKLQTLETAPTPAIVDKMFEAWSNEFDVVNADAFWTTAEMMEIVLDAYETTGKFKYRNMFNQMYRNFIINHGEDWMYNDFNDDITWISIACLRSFLLTGNQTHLNKAIDQFNKMYNRANTGDFGDGLIWKQGIFSTNSAINGPAMVALCYLAKATGDTSYYDKAITIHKWAREYMVNAETGKVIDSYRRNTETGEMEFNRWSSTYNQGSFMGASIMLYNYTNNYTYMRIADNIATFTRENMYNNGVMNNESNGTDLPGFKGIFMRYARRYVVDGNRPDYIPWLRYNARVAYSNRNRKNITGTEWGTKTPENFSGSAFSASTAVSLMVNCPNETPSTFYKNAYEKIEAEDFDYLSSVIVESSSPDGTDNLGSVRNDGYTGYHNIDFGINGSKRILIRVSSISVGTTIEVRLGGPNGKKIGTATVPDTGMWSTYTTVTAPVETVRGLQDVYLVYKGSGGLLVNVNHFTFSESVVDTGFGLLARYYNGRNFNKEVLIRNDSNIDFNWTNSSPSASVDADNFSARWIGQIIPRYSGKYTFRINSDNGRRLWINNELIIDKWTDDWGVEYMGQIELEAFRSYDIKVEYFEVLGGANIKLEWQSPQQPREVIPNSVLRSPLVNKSSSNISTIEENSTDGFNIFPNPTSNEVFFTSKNEEIPNRIILTNMAGQIVMDLDSTHSKQIQKVDMSDLPRGLYIAKVYTNDSTSELKIIKK